MKLGEFCCSTCHFWQRLRPDGQGWAEDRNYEIGDDGYGICRRLPPSGQRRDTPHDPAKGFPHLSDAALWAQWPITDGEGDWCGEHFSRTDRDTA